MPPLWPWVAKNEKTTTVSPVRGPTERSIAPVSRTTSWPRAIRPSAAVSRSMLLKLKLLRKRLFEELV